MRDGSALQILQLDQGENEAQLLLIKSVKLVDIRQIVVLAPPEIGFQLQLCDPSSNQNDSDEVQEQEELEPVSPLLFTVPTELAASKAAIVNQWVLTLTCGVNAVQQQLQSERSSKPEPPMTNLIWQAARLRIFELISVLPLPDAVALVTLGVHQFLSNDELQGLENHTQQQPLLFLKTHSV